jgi:hypothetical protein
MEPGERLPRPRPWGHQNSQTWVKQAELANLASLGGSQAECARQLGVDRGQLRRWIEHPRPWECWMPKALLPKLDQYLQSLVVVPGGVTECPGEDSRGKCRNDLRSDAFYARLLRVTR